MIVDPGTSDAILLAMAVMLVVACGAAIPVAFLAAWDRARGDE